MESSDRIACHVCGKYFYTSVSVRMHMMRVHGNVSNVEDGQQHDLPTATAAVSAPVGKKGSLCSVCNRCFPNARALTMHARVHGGADSDAVTSGDGQRRKALSSLSTITSGCSSWSSTSWRR